MFYPFSTTLYGTYVLKTRIRNLQHMVLFWWQLKDHWCEGVKVKKWWWKGNLHCTQHTFWNQTEVADYCNKNPSQIVSELNMALHEQGLKIIFRATCPARWVTFKISLSCT